VSPPRRDNALPPNLRKRIASSNHRDFDPETSARIKWEASGSSTDNYPHCLISSTFDEPSFLFFITPSEARKF
jgi:hypothetical protein